MLEKNLRYLLALAALTILTFSSTDVRAAMGTGYNNSVGNMTASAVSATSSILESIRGSIRITKSIDAKATVVGEPKLELVYAQNTKNPNAPVRPESLLKASFNISVKGGKNGVYVPKYQWVEFHTLGGKGGGYYVTSRGGDLSPASKLSSVQSEKFGESYFVPANTTKTFKLNASVDPKTLFAGNYIAKISSVYVLNSSLVESYKLALSGKQETNSKTIVGEVSPFISSVTTPVNVGNKIVISGVRFNDTKNSLQVYIDGSLLADTSFSVNSTGTEITFVLGQIAGGYHNLYVENSNGRSNYTGFEVIGSNNGSNIFILSPKDGDVLPYGVQTRIDWGGYWDGNDVFTITDVNSGGKGLIVSGLTQEQAGCPGVGKGVCSFMWTPSAVGSNNISIIANDEYNNIARVDFSVSTSTAQTLTVTNPQKGDVYDNGPAQNIIIGWSAQGNVDYYSAILKNKYVEGFGVSVGEDKISNLSNGTVFQPTELLITNFVNNSGGKTAIDIQAGYYVVVRAMKYISGYATEVATSQSGYFTISNTFAGPTNPSCPVGYVCTGTTQTPVTETPVPTVPTVTVQSTVTATCYQFSSSLSRGDEGKNVLALQEFLVSKGFLSKSSVTSSFNIATKDALMKYQTSVGLKATGILDAATRAVVNSCK